MEKLTKICTKCNCEKELTEFRFRKDTNNYRNDCKKCSSDFSKQHRLKNIDKIKERQKEYRLNNKDRKRETDRIYREQQGEELLKKKREYHYANRDSLIEKKKNYNFKNKEHISKYNKLYRQTENGKASRKNSHQKRRTKFKSGDVNTEQLKQLYINTKNCYWCNCKLEKDDTHLDHFYPLSKGGKHTINNLVLSCSSCNLSKATKHPIDFAKELDIIPHDLEFML
jgi:hypothetical protein